MNVYRSREAAQLARMGRHGDTNLLHVSNGELRNLGMLGHLSRNPQTGLPEAFNLGHALGSVAKVVATPFTAGAQGVANMVAPNSGITGALNKTSILSPDQSRLATQMVGAAGAGVLGGPLGAMGANAVMGMLPGNQPQAPQQQPDGSWGVNPMTAGAPGTGTSAAGGAGQSVLGAGFQIAGANEMLKAYEEAQRNAQNAGTFTPYNISSGMGNTSFSGAGATGSLNPTLQGAQDQFFQNAQTNAAQANQSPDQIYAQMNAQAAPQEATDRANALAQIQASGQTGLAVGGDDLSAASNPLYSSLLRAQADAARQRQVTSYSLSDQLNTGAANRAQGFLGAGLQPSQLQLSQMLAGGQLGGQSASAALTGANLAQLPILGQGFTKGGMLTGAGTALGAGGGGAGVLGSLKTAAGGALNNLGISGLGNAFGNALTGVGQKIGGLLGTSPAGGAAGAGGVSGLGGGIDEYGNAIPQAVSNIDPNTGFDMGGGAAPAQSYPSYTDTSPSYPQYASAPQFAANMPTYQPEFDPSFYGG